ncbi:MAG: DMT family transporter [Fidelibacterota bacterium]
MAAQSNHGKFPAMKAVKYLGPGAVMLAAVLWAVDGLLRQKLSDVPAFQIILLEHAIGAVVFLPVLIRGWKEVTALRERAWISVAWVSILGGIVGTVAYTKALSYVEYIDLTVVVLLQKLQPLFAISLAAVVLKEKLTRRFFILAVVALLGGYLVTFGSSSIAQMNEKTMVAALLAFVAAFAWGSSTVLGKHALKRLSFFTLTALRLWVTAIVAGTIFLSLWNRPDVLALSSDQWITILIIVFSTGSVALFIYYFGLKKVPASHATIYELFWPLTAVLFDWVLKGHVLQPMQILGALLLLGASFVLPRETQSNNR